MRKKSVPASSLFLLIAFICSILSPSLIQSAYPIKTYIEPGLAETQNSLVSVIVTAGSSTQAAVAVNEPAEK